MDIPTQLLLIFSPLPLGEVSPSAVVGWTTAFICAVLAAMALRTVVRQKQSLMAQKEQQARRESEELRKARDEVERRGELDRLVRDISSHFLNEDADMATYYALEKIGEFFGAARTYVVQIRDVSSFRATHEWRPETPTGAPVNGSLDEEDFQWLSRQALEGHTVAISDVRDLPVEASRARQLYQRQDVCSIAFIPMIHAREVAGGIGIDIAEEPRQWEQDEMDMLRQVGEIIAIAKGRQEAEVGRRESERLLRLIIDSAPAYIVYLNADGRYRMVNRQFCDPYDLDPQEIIGKHYSEVLPPEVIAAHEPLAKRALKGERLTFTHDERHPAYQDPRTIYGIYSPFTDERGTIEGVVAVMVDITERRLAEGLLRMEKDRAEVLNRELVEVNREFKRVSERRSEFLGIATHDLKNPLVAIAGLADILYEMNEGDASRDEEVEMIEAIRKSSNHMIQIIKDLTESEALDDSGVELNYERQDVGAVAREIVDINRAQAERKDLLLIDDIDTDVEATLDGRRVREILDNLLSNAIKYSPNGKRIWLRVKDEPDFVLLQIQDEGPGFTEKDRLDLYAKFKKLSARPTGGESSTGLGLAIVKRLVDLHHGRIELESSPGEGACFTVRLPKDVPALAAPSASDD